MKFLAMLKDSLLESLDSTIIYVMAGLSLLLIMVASTMTFSPKPGGDKLMQIAAVPLSLDVKDFDPERLRRKGPDPFDLLARIQGDFAVEKVAPLDGEADAPASTYRVVIQRGGIFPPKPEESLAVIRERFGVLDDVRIAEVISAEAEGGKFIVHARLTAQGRLLWPHDFALFFGALPVVREGIPLGWQLYGLQNVLVNQVGSWVALIISIIMTAFFVPNMLRKGTVDLLLVKPISRPALLIYKYVGGLIFIGLNTTLAVGGLWFMLGIRTGVWAPGPLVAIPAITFFFAILYAVSVLFGVVTRSAVVSILVTCLFWFFLFAVGLTVGILDALDRAPPNFQEPGPDGKWPGKPRPKKAPEPVEKLEKEDKEDAGPKARPFSDSTFGRVVRGVHWVLPRTNDLNTLLSDHLQRDLMVLPRALRAAAFRADPVSWGESVGVSLAFITITLGLACWWFARRDY